jgi:ABC-2 type transport system ATP-binding protein
MKNYEDKANDYLKRFELEHKKHSLTSELSRGMKQRLGLICTFLHEPKVILLDEPITALDPKGVRIFNEAILEHARNGASILVSSHQLALLQHCSTHIMVMNQGKIFYFDSLEKIKSEMKNVNETVFLEELFFKLTENK